MFYLSEFYQKAHAGEKLEVVEVLDYIKSYKNLVLWGAGNLGQAVGKWLLDEKIKITAYWDMKYTDYPICQGVPVLMPFSGEFNKEDTLVIPCIVNGSLGNHWTEYELERRGYYSYISGMAFYEGVICPLDKSYFNIGECTGRKACSLCNCERYVNLLNRKVSTPETLTFQLITFIISTRCTLNCRYCGQRLSEYEAKDRKDFDFIDIKRDIDHFLEAVDFVGMVSVIGGEPFLHPELTEIIK